KGIMHSHRSALAWAEVAAREHQLVADDRISNYAPLHFDLSTLDFFAGALAASTMVMIPEEHMRMPASLATLLEEEALSLFYTVPFALIQLVTSASLEARELPALRRVLFGGEPMTIKHLRRLQQLLPHVAFCNVYGPTEVNGCTRYFVPPLAADDAPSLPIGTPYANVEAIVVDAAGNLVASGERGELAIRAPTMMRGYWNREDLMEGAFVELQRYPACTPDRFYRTGDLVAQRDDGNFEFLGRADRLIKTRGCRVDLDEIEATLAACDGVAEAAVFPVTDATGTLAVYAAARALEEEEVTARHLLGQLKARLPSYAVPVAMEVVEAFPRTSTGKIDRRALRASAESTTEPA
ncbi:MAG: AMP-binding protein, partial [Pseudomonadota bacterium]